ncbi:hypothetical protein [Pseudomonas sp. S2_C03]
MDRVEIAIIKQGERQQADLLCDSDNTTITFVMGNGYSQSYAGNDFYQCLGQIRKEHQDVTFLCKGAKINVHPSSMSSQMTQGVKAYELTLGRNATRRDVVNIFDYEDKNLTNNPDLQKQFFERWLDTEATND